MVTKQFLASLWRRLYYYSSSNSNDTESNDLAILKAREAKPSHHLLKIESFNKLSENLSSPYIAEEFTAGGYTWLLCIHLQGDEENDGKNHVSIYLEVADTTDLPDGWEINATFNFFIYDQIRDKYVGLQEARKRRFYSMKNRWGVTKFIDLKTLNNPSKGYLINDICIFGVEVFISCTQMHLRMIREPERIYKFKWQVDNFSKKIRDKWYKSDYFVAGDYKWRMLLNPNCHALSKGSITVGLEFDTSTIPPNNRLLMNYLLRLVEQNNKDEDIEVSGSGLFYSSRYTDPSSTYGDCILEGETEHHKSPYFISLAELQDPKLGYLINDTCILEAEINILAMLHCLLDR